MTKYILFSTVNVGKKILFARDIIDSQGTEDSCFTKGKKKCRVQFYEECNSMPSAILCRVQFYAEFNSMPSAILCKVQFYAEFNSVRSAILWRVQFYAECNSILSRLFFKI